MNLVGMELEMESSFAQLGLQWTKRVIFWFVPQEIVGCRSLLWMANSFQSLVVMEIKWAN